MTTERRNFLRLVMQTAWGLFNADAKGPNPRTFADALAGAWRFCKRSAAAVAPRWAKQGAPVALASMIRSPIRRAARGPFAGVNAAHAGYVTSAFGR